MEPLSAYSEEYDVILKNLCLSQWYCEILNDFKHLDRKTHSLVTRTRISVYKEAMKRSSGNEINVLNITSYFFRLTHNHHQDETLTNTSLYITKYIVYMLNGVTWWRSRLRHCATSRKVAGSIPDGVNGIFHSHNPSGRTMALGLTQPLTEMSARNISWGVKAAGA